MAQSFCIVPTRRIPQGKRPIHLRILSDVLDELNTPKRHFRQTSATRIATHLVCRTRGAKHANYWELLETLRVLRKEFMRLHHPDFGGDTGACARFNAAYDRAIELIAARGYTWG